MKLVKLACGTLQTSAQLYCCGLFFLSTEQNGSLINFLISQLLIASVLKEKYARMKRGRRNNWFTNRALSYDWLVSVLNNVFQFIQRILSPLSTSSPVFSCFCFFIAISHIRPISSATNLYQRSCLRVDCASNAGLFFELVVLEITVAYMRPRSKKLTKLKCLPCHGFRSLISPL